MANNKSQIDKNDAELKKLKRNALYQDQYRKKKAKQLEENNEVVSHDSPGRPLLLAQHLNLNHEIMRIVDDSDSTLQGSHRRRRKIVNVTNFKHIKAKLKADADIDISYSSLLNYTLPKNPKSKAAQSHHTPAPVRYKAITRTERSNHPDSHYCAASQKYVRDIVTLLGNRCVYISQDDKAKVILIH